MGITMAKKETKKIVRIRLRRSLIGKKPKQRKTVRALGLGKIDSVVEKELNPSINGMINAVSHLVEVEEIE
jgi:large subunit ribosomal protein L30